MLVRIPPAETEINASDKRYSVVDYDELFVVCLVPSVLILKNLPPIAYPVQRHVSRVFKDIVIWVTEYSNVAVTRGSFRAEILQDMFGVRRVASQSLIDLDPLS